FVQNPVGIAAEQDTGLLAATQSTLAHDRSGPLPRLQVGQTILGQVAIFQAGLAVAVDKDTSSLAIAHLAAAQHHVAPLSALDTGTGMAGQLAALQIGLPLLVDQHAGILTGNNATA